MSTYEHTWGSQNRKILPFVTAKRFCLLPTPLGCTDTMQCNSMRRLIAAAIKMCHHACKYKYDTILEHARRSISQTKLPHVNSVSASRKSCFSVAFLWTSIDISASNRITPTGIAHKKNRLSTSRIIMSIWMAVRLQKTAITPLVNIHKAGRTYARLLRRM